jgi:hypothetical protein
MISVNQCQKTLCVICEICGYKFLPLWQKKQCNQRNIVIPDNDPGQRSKTFMFFMNFKVKNP